MAPSRVPRVSTNEFIRQLHNAPGWRTWRTTGTQELVLLVADGRASRIMMGPDPETSRPTRIAAFEQRVAETMALPAVAANRKDA